MNFKVLFCCCLIFVMACKNDSGQNGNDEFSKLENEVKDSKDPKKALEYLTLLNTKIKEGDNNIIDLLQKGLKVSKQFNLPSETNTYLMMLSRTAKTSQEHPLYIYELASRLKSAGKTSASNVLFSGFIQHFPSSDKIAAAKSSLTEPINNVDTFMTQLAEKIFENPDDIGINKRNAQKYVDACEAHALAFDNEHSPTYLYKASEMARTIRTFPKTLSIYDWILEDYPNSEKAASALFLKGFIAENELKNIDLAKQCYQEFLDKYPSHNLADDIKFLLENIGKSDEEIYKIIEKNSKK